MSYHRYSIGPLTDPLMASPTSKQLPYHPNRMGIIVQIAWLRHFTISNDKVRRLMGRFAGEGIDVWLVNGDHLPLEQVLCFDLILLESSSKSIPQMQKSLKRIRLGSRAPLILLTDEYSVQWSLDALQAGADAILPINAPNDVVLARCRALLRRWLSDINGSAI